MPRDYFTVYDEIALCNGAVPDIVITLSRSLEGTAGFFENGFYFRGEGLRRH